MQKYRTSRFSVQAVTFVVCVALASLFVSPHNVHACWAYVPQEIRMAEADLVIAGKLQKLGKDVQKNGTVYQVGIIKPTKILKGKPAPTAEIKLAWPKPRPGGLRLSTDLAAPKVGESSIWVLTADDKLDVFWANYPTDRQPIDKLKDMEQKMETLKKIQWSKPKNGAQFGIFVEQRDMRQSTTRIDGKLVKALAQMSVYTMVKNATDKPIHLVDYPYDSPFSIDFIDPDGKPIKVKTELKSPRKPPIQKHNFIKAGPTRIKTIGHGFQLGVATKPGAYNVTVRYKNTRDGKAVGIEDVWTGEGNSPTVSFRVAK